MRFSNKSQTEFKRWVPLTFLIKMYFDGDFCSADLTCNKRETKYIDDFVTGAGATSNWLFFCLLYTYYLVIGTEIIYQFSHI